jgi:two-component SAPR family response regulator
MHIIATDDEQSALNVLMGAIREAVPLATVHGFRNPLEALEFIKNTKCDIAFLDISMRGMSGLALAEEILKIRPKCKIIFCTGYTEYALDAIKLHCSGYLTKPITKESVQKELDYIKGLNNSDEQLKVKCFGNFEVFINGEVLQFKRSKTKELFANYLKDASIVVWNGPLGVYEFSKYKKHTDELLEYIVENNIRAILGGGDIVAAASTSGYKDKVYHASTGGGATLEYLEGKSLPGIEAVK